MSPADHLLSLIRGFWGDPEPCGATLIRIDGACAGHLQVCAGTPDSVRIQNLLIEEGFRGRGVGPSVMRALCKLADEAGCGLSLEAFHRPDREGGGLAGLYARFGFEVEGGPCEQGYLELARPPSPAPDPEGGPQI